MEEVIIEYYDDDGNIQEESFMVPTMVKERIEDLLYMIEDLETKSEYYRRLFEMHMTTGIMTN